MIRTEDGFTDLKASFGKTYRIFPEDWKNHRKKPHVYFLEMGIPHDQWVYYWEIVGKHGKIYAYGKDGSLAVEINSRNHKTMASIWHSPEYKGLMPILDCAREGTYKFSPEILPEVAKAILARKRKFISSEQMDEMRLRLLEARQKRMLKP